MEPTQLPSAGPGTSPTDAPADVPISGPAPSAAEPPQPDGEVLPSAAQADENPTSTSTVPSAATIQASLTSSTGEASELAPMALAHPAPAAGSSIDMLNEAVAGDESSPQATQYATAAAPESPSEDRTAPAILSPVNAAPTDNAAAESHRTTLSEEVTDFPASTDPLASDTANAPQHPASVPELVSTTTSPVASALEPSSSSTTALPAASSSGEAVPQAKGPAEGVSQQSSQPTDGTAPERTQASQVATSANGDAFVPAVEAPEARIPPAETVSAASNLTAAEGVTQTGGTDAPTRQIIADIASKSQGDEVPAASALLSPGSAPAPDRGSDSKLAATDSEAPKEGVARTYDKSTAGTSSSSDDAVVPAEDSIIVSEAAPASTPATPEKKASTDATSAAQANASQPSTPAREGRVALILRINKELIRFCVDLQAKELTMDPVYREAAVRLQANLAYLASVADKAGKSVDGGARAPPSGALPRLEPFPRSEHAPSSPLAALYDKLITIFEAARQTDSPAADGKKRSRDSTADLSTGSSRKRATSKGVDHSRDPSAAATPSSSANLHQSIVGVTAPTPSVNTFAPTSTSASAQPPQLVQAPQAAPQQSSQGPDLSLAPPVPIAPPTAAQNIPNNPQAHALMQAFGPNALVNLHALQSHLRGQGTHPWVSYTEANVNGFKSMPLQMQLQHMTSLQNAALQRQKAMPGGGESSGVGSPATMASPAGTRPGSRHSNSPGQAQGSPIAGQFGARTGTPLGGAAKRPGSSGSATSAGRNRTGSSNLAFDPAQSASSPMASVTDFAAQQPNFGFQPPGGLQQGSPPAASPGPQQQPGMMGMANFQNLPPHLQQQIRQQYMAHMQAQQAQGQQQGFNPQPPQQQSQQQQGWNFQAPQ